MTKKNETTNSVQEQIAIELQDPLCIDANEILDSKYFEILFEYSEAFEPLISKALALLQLRLTQLEINVSDEEIFDLQEVLGIYFSFEVVSSISFHEIVKLSKEELLVALAEVREQNN